MRKKKYHDEADNELDDDGTWVEIDPDAPADRPRAPRKPAAAELLLRDDDLLVVNKPADLPLLPVGDAPDCLLDQLCNTLDVDEDRIRFVDRLDAGASGLMLVARSAGAETDLGRQFAQQTVQRVYLALVHGVPAEAQGVIDLEIGPDRKRSDIMRIGGAHARPAVTHWKLVDRFTNYSLLEVRPQTDRTHQVRLHLQAMGMPLAVDVEYGGSESLLLSSFKADYHRSKRHEERPLIARLSLHSASLSFRHPRDGRDCRFDTSPPKDFRAAVNQLGKYGRLGA